MNTSNKFEYYPQKETAMIRAAIHDLGYTQEFVARKIKKTPGTVSAALTESRKANPTLSEIKSFIASEILKQKKKSRKSKV